jgi:hypothetical protein
VETLEENISPTIHTNREAWLCFLEQTAGTISDSTFETDTGKI